jgi:hypothetical protein
MTQDIELRNFQTFTTGDFDAFEFLQDGQWKQGHITRTALHLLAAGKTEPHEATFAAHKDVIVRAARAAQYDPARQAHVVSSDSLKLA